MAFVSEVRLGVSVLYAIYTLYRAKDYPVLRRYDMNGRFRLQEGKNWILPK